MLKHWWFIPECDLLSLAWQVRPLVSSQPSSQEWTVYSHWSCPVKHSPNPQILISIWPILIFWGICICIGRRDDQIRQISQASNIKKPTHFLVTSWIVGSDEGHDSAIRSVWLFCHITSTSATLYQDMFGNITTSSAKVCQITGVLRIMRVVRQSQQKRKKNTKQNFFWNFLAFL